MDKNNKPSFKKLFKGTSMFVDSQLSGRGGSREASSRQGRNAPNSNTHVTYPVNLISNTFKAGGLLGDNLELPTEMPMLSVKSKSKHDEVSGCPDCTP